MDENGSFLRGLIMSIVGALIGALLWYGVVIATDYELGLIAWGVGILAGLGMLLGYRETDDLGGITAAFVALAAIFAAKGFMWLSISGNAVIDVPELRRELLAGAIAEQKLKRRRTNTDNIELTAEYVEASAQVRNLTDSEVSRRLAKQNPESELLIEMLLSEVTVSYWDLFDPYDGIFTLLAFFTAYKVGARGIGGDD